MQVKILYFATFRSITGLREEVLTLSDRATLQDLMGCLVQIHPPIEGGLPSAVFAINREFAFPEDELQDGDEVAIFPPVSGGSREPTIHLQIMDDPIDMNAALQTLLTTRTAAACVFTDRWETKAKGKTPAIRAYPQRSEIEGCLRKVADEICASWSNLQGLALILYDGTLNTETPSVLVACTAGRREESVFEAARYGMERVRAMLITWDGMADLPKG